MPSIFTQKPDPLELRLRLEGVSGWLKTWLPALIAVVIIFVESTEMFSSDNTSHFLRPMVEGLFGRIRDAIWSEEHHLLRKTGHFVGYGLVCLTFLRGWLLRLGCVTDLGRKAWRWRSVALGLLCAFLVASADEFHQTFLPGRTGKFTDVLLDTSGGVVACTLIWFFFWRGKGRRRRSAGRTRLQAG